MFLSHERDVVCPDMKLLHRHVQVTFVHISEVLNDCFRLTFFSMN